MDSCQICGRLFSPSVLHQWDDEALCPLCGDWAFYTLLSLGFDDWDQFFDVFHIRPTRHAPEYPREAWQRPDYVPEFVSRG